MNIPSILKLKLLSMMIFLTFKLLTILSATLWYTGILSACTIVVSDISGHKEKILLLIYFIVKSAEVEYPLILTVMNGPLSISFSCSQADSVIPWYPTASWVPSNLRIVTSCVLFATKYECNAWLDPFEVCSYDIGTWKEICNNGRILLQKAYDIEIRSSLFLSDLFFHPVPVTLRYKQTFKWLSWCF